MKDSFRRDILIPAFEELNQEIESFTAEMERLQLLVGVLQGVNATMIFLLTLLIWTLRNDSLKPQSIWKNSRNAANQLPKFKMNENDK